MPLEPDKHVGKIVEVKFLDHVWGGESDLVLCTVWGRLISDDWQKIVVRVWDSDGDDHEYATLIRAAVISIRPLTYKENSEC